MINFLLHRSCYPPSPLAKVKNKNLIGNVLIKQIHQGVLHGKEAWMTKNNSDLHLLFSLHSLISSSAPQSDQVPQEEMTTLGRGGSRSEFLGQIEDFWLQL